jgi:hypothetical protein
MTARSAVTVLAISAFLCLPGMKPGVAAELRLAQSASPLEIPAAPAAPPPAAASPATPNASPAGPGEPGAATDLHGSSPDLHGQPPSAQEEDSGDSPDNEELSLGEIPIIETIELTPDMARRALDSYIAAREKFVNSDLELYENLQDFVDQTEDGKAFEADIKAAGFANVSDWNLAITTLGLAYGGIVDDQTPDLLLQIQEVEQDTEMAQDIKDRMVKALKALIPSDNNRKVIEDLLDDPVYSGKLKLLDIEEE